MHSESCFFPHVCWPGLFDHPTSYSTDKLPLHEDDKGRRTVHDLCRLVEKARESDPDLRYRQAYFSIVLVQYLACNQ